MSNTAKTSVLKEYADKIGVWPAGAGLLVMPHDVDELTKGKGPKAKTIQVDGNEFYEGEGGLLIAKESREMTQMKFAVSKGTVIAVGFLAFKDFGHGEHQGQPWCKPGDVVHYPRNAGKKVKDPKSGEEFQYIYDSDVRLVESDTPPGYAKEEWTKLISNSGE